MTLYSNLAPDELDEVFRTLGEEVQDVFPFSVFSLITKLKKMEGETLKEIESLFDFGSRFCYQWGYGSFLMQPLSYPEYVIARTADIAGIS